MISACVFSVFCITLTWYSKRTAENEPSADYKTFFSKPLKMTVPEEFIKVTKMGATVTHETHSDE